MASTARTLVWAVFLLGAAPALLAGQARSDTAGYTPAECPSCTEWNAPSPPVRLFGNTWYVGTRGLAALLITSPDGHILLDGGLPESAPGIIAGIRAAGFRVEDVRVIANSHEHFDHAGGIAALQRSSGAVVVASPRGAAALRSGVAQPDDPQHGVALAFPRVRDPKVIADGDTIAVGRTRIVAVFTPGHAPGGTSWSWQSCEGERCLWFVYADSQTPVSADDFQFSRSSRYPHAVSDFERSFARLEQLPCDILVTPHPYASRLWERLEAGPGEPGLVDDQGCRGYVAGARQALARRLATERALP